MPNYQKANTVIIIDEGKNHESKTYDCVSFV